MNPGQLVPAVRAHGLQFGVSLQGLHSLVKALEGDEHQAQPIPGPVKLFIYLNRLAKCRLGLTQTASLLQQKGQIEPVPSAALRVRLHQCLRHGQSFC